MTDHPSTTDTTPRRKSVLFCPDCGHESQIDGDWAIHRTDDRETYDCPVCGATITTRARSRPVPAC